MGHMNTQNTQNKYTFGLKGQDWFEQKLIEYGYSLYKKNIKRIGLEIDLVMYKHLREKNILLIHIIEVKTRRNLGREVDLESLDIKRKWLRVKQMMFDIPQAIKDVVKIDDCRHTLSFDLAVILDKGGVFNLHKYIQNVNLLL